MPPKLMTMDVFARLWARARKSESSFHRTESQPFPGSARNTCRPSRTSRGSCGSMPFFPACAASDSGRSRSKHRLARRLRALLELARIVPARRLCLRRVARRATILWPKAPGLCSVKFASTDSTSSRLARRKMLRLPVRSRTIALISSRFFTRPMRSPAAFKSSSRSRSSIASLRSNRSSARDLTSVWVRYSSSLLTSS